MKKVLSKIGSVLWGLLEVLIIVYVLCITMCILCRNKYGYTQFDKYTLVTLQEETYRYIDGSEDGDLLVVKRGGDIVKGDVIYYYININDQYVVKTGVVESLVDGETTSLYTLNDDVKTTVASSKVLGKEMKLYSSWGTILDLLMSRFGFLFLVLLPILVVFIYQIYEFIMVLKFEKIEEEVPKKKKVIKEKETNNSKDDIELL